MCIRDSEERAWEEEPPALPHDEPEAEPDPDEAETQGQEQAKRKREKEEKKEEEEEEQEERATIVLATSATKSQREAVFRELIDIAERQMDNETTENKASKYKVTSTFKGIHKSHGMGEHRRSLWCWKCGAQTNWKKLEKLKTD